MTGITYGLVEELRILNGHERISYGIAVYSDAELDGCSTVIASVSDITSDKQLLAELVLQCNLLGLSMVHLQDVINDFLAN